MNRSRTSAAFPPFLFIGALVGGILAKESPSFIATLSGFIPQPGSHRQDFCERQELVQNGTISLDNALRNLSLNVGLADHRTSPSKYRYSFLDEDGTIPVGYPGYLVTILDELADRAGFTWRESFFALPIKEIEQSILDQNATYEDFLKWSVDRFDLSINLWARSIERMAMGASFPEPFYDFNTILAQTTQATEAKFEFNAFLRPFTSWVWVLIVASMIFTGVTYWWLKHIDARMHGTNLEENVEDAIYSSAMIFAGGGDFETTTRATRLVAFSWFFAILVIGASYTANMASFLVAQKNQNYLITSMAEAGADKKRICIRNEGYTFETVKSIYGNSGIVLVPYLSDSEALNALARGACDAYVGDEGKLKEHGDCSIQFNGVYLLDVSHKNGFAVATDAGIKCSSLMYHAIDGYLMQMKIEGFFDKAWQEYLDYISIPVCAEESGGDQGQLDVLDMGGVFLLHLIFCAVAVLIVLGQYCTKGSAS